VQASKGEGRSGRVVKAGMTYPAGEHLSAQLSADTWRKLVDYARGRGLEPRTLESLRPSGVFLTLMGIEMQRLGVTEEGVDMNLYRRALADGKPVQGLSCWWGRRIWWGRRGCWPGRERGACRSRRWTRSGAMPIGSAARGLFRSAS